MMLKFSLSKSRIILNKSIISKSNNKCKEEKQCPAFWKIVKLFEWLLKQQEFAIIKISRIQAMGGDPRPSSCPLDATLRS